MERVGEITAAENGWLEVTFCRMTDCGECHACMGTKKETTVRVRGEGKVGDGAVITMPTSTVMKASAAAYILPLVGLLAGMMLGNVLGGGQDAGTALGALLGLGTAIALLYLTERRRKNDPRWNPTLVELIPHAEYMSIPKGVMNHGNESDE